MQRHAQHPDKNTSIKLCRTEQFNVRAWGGEAVVYDRESGDLHYLDSSCYQPFAALQSITDADGISSFSIAQLSESSSNNEQDLLNAISHLEKIGLVEILP